MEVLDILLLNKFVKDLSLDKLQTLGFCELFHGASIFKGKFLKAPVSHFRCHLLNLRLSNFANVSRVVCLSLQLQHLSNRAAAKQPQSQQLATGPDIAGQDSFTTQRCTQPGLITWRTASDKSWLAQSFTTGHLRSGVQLFRHSIIDNCDFNVQFKCFVEMEKKL